MVTSSILPGDLREAVPCGRKRASVRPSLRRLLLFCLCSLLYLLFLVAAPKLGSLSTRFSPFPFLDSSAGEDEDGRVNTFLCSNVPKNSICCDRTTSFRSDVCIMRGDIRTHASSSALLLYSDASAAVPGNSVIKGYHSSSDPVPATAAVPVSVEKIRPYTRKWETYVMGFVQELRLVITAGAPTSGGCDVTHDVPAVVFSTGGYTGNVYHEFNDGILPLYITSHGFRKKVVFVILDYHKWWVTKYADVLSQMSDHPPVDFSGDSRTHCFSQAVVGLQIHDDLSIDPSRMIIPGGGKGRKPVTILDFRMLLDRAYRPRIRSLELEEEKVASLAKESAGQSPSPAYPNGLTDHNATQQRQYPKSLASFSGNRMADWPRLVIISRNGSRGVENEADLVSLCEQLGFIVLVLRPDRKTELAKIYKPLNQTDVMIGVHGAAMTHLLFLRPCSAFIQIVPLGTDWAAETYYGQPAKKLGLIYVAYKILPRESSLYTKYPHDHPVLRDPTTLTSRGWEVTKQVYLDEQTVRLDLNRFRKTLVRAYRYTVSRRRKKST